MMAAQLRGVDGGEGAGIGQALKNGLAQSIGLEEQKKEPVVLKNRAGESKSPYVRAHAENPVAWQIWGDEAIELARQENKLLFISIGYSACHWCHVMERESFENEEVAAILNDAFIPVKIDREERPDIDRIYMNFVQATTGSGGWPLNVFVTPDLHPVFGGTYWPGPTSTTQYEDQVNFLGILDKLSTVWREQEQRCRQDSGQILQQLKDFAAEGTFGNRLGDGGDGLDIELLEEANHHFASTYDSKNGGFGSAPKFPTPSKLAFLLRIGQYPQVVRDVVGETECENAENMAISTLLKIARGGIHDHIGNGFARYSVTADWSLPHFEKMLFDNAQLLHIYLDGFLLCRDPELLGTVYDIATYLMTTLAHPDGGFYSSEDADSYYKKGDAEKREGAFYVWTKREFENVLGSEAEPILSAFLNVKADGNVLPENDAHDEFIDQNVLAIVTTPTALAKKFGLKEEEVVTIIKDGKLALREHREKERVRPALDDKIVVAWNGLAIGALARAASVIKGFDPEKSEAYFESAIKAATFIKDNLFDESTSTLYRVWREGRGDTEGFADDYAFLIEGLIDLYEAIADEKWLKWADELQKSQISRFYDTSSTGAFFSTPASAPHIILRLKDGMDTSEPSTNGTSASNLYRLSSLLADESYAQKAKETASSFESEMLQYPWLFASFMPSIVAGKLGLRGVVVSEGKGKEVEGVEARDVKKIKEFEKAPRGGLGTFIKIDVGDAWLRERNELLTRFGLDGKGRVLVCEGGVCTEEGLEEREETKAKAEVESESGVAVQEEAKSSTLNLVAEEAKPSTAVLASTTEEETKSQVLESEPEPTKIAESATDTMPQASQEAKIEKAEQAKDGSKDDPTDTPVAATVPKDLEKALPVVLEPSLSEQTSIAAALESTPVAAASSGPSEPVIDSALKRELIAEQGKDSESTAATTTTSSIPAVGGGKNEQEREQV